MIDPSELNVLIPNPDGGVSVVEVSDLVGKCDEYDNLDELTTNIAFDSTMFMGDRMTPELLRMVDRVRELNRTNDPDAYWAQEREG